MAEVVGQTLDILSGGNDLPHLGPNPATPMLEDVLEADRVARRRAAEAIGQMKG
jgi:hypothetical protein